MGTSIAELIADRIDAMPAGERRAAQTLVANYPLIGLKTVADFSAQAGVSSPTILRFVARLGFDQAVVSAPGCTPRLRLARVGTMVGFKPTRPAVESISA